MNRQRRLTSNERKDNEAQAKKKIIHSDLFEFQIILDIVRKKIQ